MVIPQRVLDLAARRRLGGPVRAFDARRQNRRAVVWLLLLGTAGLLLVPASWYYIADGVLWLGVPGALAAVVYLGGMCRLLYGGALRGWGESAYLFEHGLVRVRPRRRGGAVACHWDDLGAVTMAGLRRTPRRRVHWRLKMIRGDGGTMTLGDELSGVDELGEVVVAEVTRRMVPRYLAAIRSGGTVRIGPFRVDGRGIDKDGESVPWTAVRAAGISNGLVYVRRADDLAMLNAMAFDTPNAIAFVTLCDEMRSHPVARSG